MKVTRKNLNTGPDVEWFTMFSLREEAWLRLAAARVQRCRRGVVGGVLVARRSLASPVVTLNSLRAPFSNGARCTVDAARQVAVRSTVALTFCGLSRYWPLTAVEAVRRTCQPLAHEMVARQSLLYGRSFDHFFLHKNNDCGTETQF